MTESEFTQMFADALNKAEIRNTAKSDPLDFSKRNAQDVLEQLGALITKEMKRKDKKDKSKYQTVPVKFVGRFRLNNRKARMGRNPQTGEQIKIKASKKARVTLPKPMRDALGSK